MQAVWQRIERWLAAHAPEVGAGLRPPATREQIKGLEDFLGAPFPQELIETFLIHNGQNPDGPFLFDAFEFLSVERIRDEWVVWKQLLDRGDFKAAKSRSDGQTLTDWWNPLWIPLTYDGSGNHDCLDLSPGPKGQKGQIIRLWHDDAERTVLATSYKEWINKFVDDLEAGHYFMSDEFNGVVRKGD